VTPAQAFGDPHKVKVKWWRCPKCRAELAQTWSTWGGRVFNVWIPAREFTSDELRQLRGRSGPRRQTFGHRWVEFVEHITESEVTAICGLCGPQRLDISDLSGSVAHRSATLFLDK
jgi:hypothetical protein